jgi:hypothetical protein
MNVKYIINQMDKGVNIVQQIVDKYQELEIDILLPVLIVLKTLDIFLIVNIKIKKIFFVLTSVKENG